MRFYHAVAARVAGTCLAAALLLALGAAEPLHGQLPAVAGRVTAAGAPVPNVSVVLSGGALTRSRTAITGVRGEFSFPNLPAGSYDLAVRAPGLRPVQRSGLRPGEQVEISMERLPAALSAVITTATRSASALTEVPLAVTVIEREQIAGQAQVTPRLGPVLSQLVPGLSAGTETISNYGQSLRGRPVLVLIDGVPQSTNRNVSRDFATIDPAMVERIEVVRGATSLYGDGATGGIINLITRRGSSSGLRFTTDVAFETSPAAFSDAAGPRIAQTVSGARGAIDFVAGASLTRTGGMFDAEGDRIPPDPSGQGGSAETNALDLLGKLGWTSGQQRLQLSGNWFRGVQDTDHAIDAAASTSAGKATARPGLKLEQGQGSTNGMVNAEYHHASVLGSALRAQAYIRGYETTFGPGDYRAFPSLGSVIFQSFVQSRKAGTRMEMDTPLGRASGVSVLWGLDYTAEQAEQQINTFDGAAFDASNGLEFARTGTRPWVPPIDQRNLGLFAQAKASPLQALVLRAGVRHERASFAVDDFTAINGVSFTGGTLDFAPTLFNAGATVTFNSVLNVFANYSQGFSLADLGRVVRQPPSGFALNSGAAEAQRVNQYEAGVRAAWARVQASAVAFRNTSDLGTSFNAALDVVRAPERVYGTEFTLDAQPLRTLTIGGTASWSEGEQRVVVNGDSTWRTLDNTRIQPAKLTAHLEHQTLPRWSNRVQLLRSSNRDRAYDEYVQQPGADPARAPFARGRIESYATVDLLSQLQVGAGTVSLGVRNLLDEQYYPVISQTFGGLSTYSAASGRMVSVGYSVTY